MTPRNSLRHGLAFAQRNTDALSRPGARVVGTEGRGRSGAHVRFEHGQTLSVQWGQYNYGSNYDGVPGGWDAPTVPDATEAEIAIIGGPGRDLLRWADGDTVQGWCSWDQVQQVLDRLAEGPVTEPVDMGWEDDA